MVKRMLFGSLLILLLSMSVFAQMDLSMGLYSKNVWRGLELNQTPLVVPELTYNLEPLKIGISGLYPLDRNANVFDEIDMYLKFYNETSFGIFSITAKDYYLVGVPTYKNSFANYNNWDNAAGPGAHLIELVGYWTKYGFDVLAGVNIWNDESNTIYTEVGYTFGNQKMCPSCQEAQVYVISVNLMGKPLLGYSLEQLRAVPNPVHKSIIIKPKIFLL